MLTIEEATKRAQRSAQAKNVDVVQLAPSTIIECRECGHRWGVLIQTGGRWPRGWRLCPEGCNG